MKLCKKKVVILALIAMFQNIYAADFSNTITFYSNATDVSIIYLAQLFGNVGDVLFGGNNTIIGELFSKFNYGVLGFTIAILSYVGVLSVISTATEGKLLGEKLNTWTILRSSLGLGFLTPLASGYCGIQIMIISIVVQGVNLANTLWYKSIDIISTNSENGLTSSNVNALSSTDAIATILGENAYSKTVTYGNPVTFNNLLRSALCAKTMYEYDNSGAKKSNTIASTNGTGVTVTQLDSSNYGVFIINQDNYKRLCFGAKGYSIDTTTSGVVADSYDCSCGIYDIPSSSTVTSTPSDATSSTDELYINLENSMKQATYIVNFANNYYDYILNSNYDDVCAYDSSSESGNCALGVSLLSVASSYSYYVTNIINSNTQECQSDSNNIPSWITNAKSTGWLNAPLHYSDMTTTTSTYCPKSTSYTTTNFMPYSISTTDNSNVMYNSDRSPSGACVKTCTTSDNSVEFCTGKNTANNQCKKDSSYVLDSDVTNSWNSIDEKNGILEKTFNYSVDQVGDLTSSAPSSSAAGNLASLSKSLNYRFFDPLIMTFIKRFKVKTSSDGYQPSGLTNNLQHFGYPRIIINATIVLVTKVMSTLVGLDMYGDKGMSDLFGFQVVGNGVPKTTTKCLSKKCYSLDSCKISDCLLTDTTDSTKPVGILGQIYKLQNSEYFDSLTSTSLLGRTMLKYTTGYILKTTENTYKDLQKVISEIMGTMLSTTFLMAVVINVFGMARAYSSTYLLQTLTLFMKMFLEFHKTIMFIWLPIAFAISGDFLTLGFILGIYLPFLPLLLFLSAVISWFISVVEAMVAGPLVAMGMTHPKGHELMGKSEQAVMLLLGVFVRPATIIIGFIVAINLSDAAVWIANVSFVGVFMSIINSTAMPNQYGGTILAVLALMILYCYFICVIYYQSFSLIYHIPNKILRWVGSPGDYSGETAKQMVRSVASEVQSSSQSLGDSSSGAVQATRNQKLQIRIPPSLEASKFGNDDTRAAYESTEETRTEFQNRARQLFSPITNPASRMLNWLRGRG